MKSKWKVVIGILVLLLATGGVLGGIKYSRRNIVTVQTGKVVREDLAAVVTASGEVKPRNYINIGAEYQGQLTADSGEGRRSRPKRTAPGADRRSAVGCGCGGAEGGVEFGRGRCGCQRSRRECRAGQYQRSPGDAGCTRKPIWSAIELDYPARPGTVSSRADSEIRFRAAESGIRRPAGGSD